MKKKVISVFFLILCLVIIFCFSNQTAKESIRVSNKIAIGTIKIKENITKKEVSEEEKINFIMNSRTLIRKSAHFLIYLILGIFTLLTCKNFNIKKSFWYAILFCFLYACSDELHQYFISERTARLLDVLIDTLGALLGISIIYLINKINLKKKDIL